MPPKPRRSLVWGLGLAISSVGVGPVVPEAEAEPAVDVASSSVDPSTGEPWASSPELGPLEPAPTGDPEPVEDGGEDAVLLLGLGPVEDVVEEQLLHHGGSHPFDLGARCVDQDLPEPADFRCDVNHTLLVGLLIRTRTVKS